ncbi:PROLINE-RICH RECEPTOR-LIKE PROTEIN KINASE PERK4 [Salix koriyanagi]|uniref:PROLINE-RICH RECEPTOR-LIKE PROTEIN KINASE PERK4 n=2 Tax=Salix TaxID=40685 RepID=A0A9Q0YT16_9ROSI|nr:PROLINE-RICH RECEPTOR-LIKE PROTEIN KINASE PERK4 [Salix koriyanagi]
MRPNNILVTHDFEPLVADFGLARWHAECNISSEGRVNRTSGYLAPEYSSSGKNTPTVDVFAFGVVLLELMTEPSHALENIYQLLDPCLASEQLPDFAYQLEAVGLAASLCLHQDPETRPPMSKVLRILEGGDLAVPLSLDLNSVGNRSGRLPGLSLNTA